MILDGINDTCKTLSTALTLLVLTKIVAFKCKIPPRYSLIFEKKFNVGKLTRMNETVTLVHFCHNKRLKNYEVELKNVSFLSCKKFN